MGRIPIVTSLVAVAAAVMLSVPGRPLAASQDPKSPDQVLAAIKQSLGTSQKQIRQYEWIETTIISLKGEEKARKVNRAYYGADGKLVKVPMGDAPQKPAEPDRDRGRRGGGNVKERIIENKVEDMQNYMEQASKLIAQYVPPDAALIQKAKDANKMAVKPSEGRVLAEISDYLLAGDMLSIAVDPKAARLLGLNVATYLEKPEDKVTLAVGMGTLSDGTVYTSKTTLDATAKNIRVVIENSGHKPMK
jgi:hypothetical protein